MADLCIIPVTYKEGTYSPTEFHKDIKNGIDFDYDAQYQILTYTVPVGENHHEIRLYQIPNKELMETLHISYDKNGQLQKITARLWNNKETLLYISYADLEDAKQKIKSFAVSNADSIAELVCTCTDIVARLFIEYFWDGEAIDFHALLGTPAQKEALEKKYPKYDDIGDNSGDYSSDFIYGDNHTFGIMISCSEYEKFDFFQYAVDIMAERIKEKAVPMLHKSNDFKFICDMYD